MKLQNLVLGPALLGSSEALSLPKDFDTSLITRAQQSSLKWGPCNLPDLETPKERECATLTVPLDYTGSVSGETIQLQLVKAKATKEPVKGSVLYNPGGPGESAVEQIATGGHILVEALGGNFNAIAFDPRGVGRTIPFSCGNLTSSAKSRRSELVLPESDNTFLQGDPWPELKAEGWKQAGEVVDLCFKNQQKYGRFVGTTSVARDMLAVVDALGEGSQLKYWGVSYGTLLGQVFAAMFPDRVGRMLLDGNVYLEDYFSTGMSMLHRDTEKAIVHVFAECIKAGSKECPLADYAGPDTTPEDLRLALQAVFLSLLTDPSYVTADDPEGGNTMLLNLKNAIVPNLYSPFNYPLVAQTVLDALEDNWDAVFNTTPKAAPERPWNQGANALIGIRCADSSLRTDSVDDLYSLIQGHMLQGSISDSGIAPMAVCAQWKLDAVEKFNVNTARNVKTSAPILFVNGIYDPVTPTISAFLSSARYRGSRVVIHEGAGHGITAHPSDCVTQVVRDYFGTGKMPELGLVCEPNKSVWDLVKERREKQKSG